MNNSKRRSIFRRTVKPLLVLGLSVSLLLSFVYTVFAQYIKVAFPDDFLLSASEFAIQSNGDIVVPGYTTINYPVPEFDGPALAFFHSDGGLNTSYAPDGSVDIDPDISPGSIRSIAVQSDDKIILATRNDFDEHDHLERYNFDGSLDTSFDASVMQPIRIRTIIIQPDDKIIVAGSNDQGSTTVYGLGRYNPDGSPDTSFDGDGWLTTDFSGESRPIVSVAVLSNGNIVAVGTVAGDFAVAVYNPDGSLDNGFDEDGTLTTDFGGGNDIAHSVAVQLDDKIIVAGGSDQDSTAQDLALARYNPDGSLDTSFSDDGLLTTDFNSGDDYIESIAIQPDGKIVVAGRTEDPDVYYLYRGDLAMARYLPDGELDTDFGVGGKNMFDLTSGIAPCCNRDRAHEVELGIDGTIVVLGRSSDATGGFYDVLFLLEGNSNQTPELEVNNAGVTIDEGQIAANSGTVSDANEDALTLTSSIGSITDNNDGTWSWSYTPDDGPSESQIVTITAEDGNGGSAQATFDLTVNNVEPTATFTHDGPVGEGSTFTLSLINPFDPSSADTNAGFEYAFDCGDGTGYHAFSISNSAACPTYDNGVRAARGQVRDKDGGVSEYMANVSVNNLAPTISGINGPSDPVQVGTAINFTAVFNDPSELDTHSLYWDWDDSSSDSIDPATSPASITHTFAAPGVYTIVLTVSDDDGGVTTGKYEYVVVYDSEGVFVTGAGWIDSPAGAYTPDPSLTGKATFGFVSKYKKGTSVPTGNTEFMFKVADLIFQSTSYEWLVVTGSNYVRFKGEGTINNSFAPNGEPYKFMIWAGDGESDTFRIRIWYEENEEEYPVYDNGKEQAIGGGSIAVHK